MWRQNISKKGFPLAEADYHWRMGDDSVTWVSGPFPNNFSEKIKRRTFVIFCGRVGGQFCKLC